MESLKIPESRTPFYLVSDPSDALGMLISKPPLTDKWLNRPPFRYLHDIITELIRSTGFLKGLFSAEEMNSVRKHSRQRPEDVVPSKGD